MLDGTIYEPSKIGMGVIPVMMHCLLGSNSVPKKVVLIRRLMRVFAFGLPMS